MSAQQGRLAALETRLGFNGDPCPICAHRPGASRCMSPEEESELDAMSGIQILLPAEVVVGHDVPDV